MKDLTERFVIHVFIVNTLKPDINLLFKTFLKSPLNVTDCCILLYPQLLFLVKTCAVIDCTARAVRMLALCQLKRFLVSFFFKL